LEEFGDIGEAIGREKEIKKMTRKRKIGLIRVDESRVEGFERRVAKPQPESGILRAAATRENDNLSSTKLNLRTTLR